MSTGAQCRFRQVEPNEWQYELQRYPYGETPDFDVYGKFQTFGDAHDDLHNNHANPGGFMVMRLEGFDCPHDGETTPTRISTRDGLVDAIECRMCGNVI